MSTITEKTRDIMSLDGRPMYFIPVENGAPERRYAITGVPQEVEGNILLHSTPQSNNSRESQQRNYTNHEYGPDFDVPLPDKIRIGFGPQLTVRLYVPDPPQCYKCYRWGNVAKYNKYGIILEETSLYIQTKGEPPIKTEIKMTTINYLIRATTRPQPTPIIRLFQDSLRKTSILHSPTHVSSDPNLRGCSHHSRSTSVSRPL